MRNKVKDDLEQSAYDVKNYAEDKYDKMKDEGKNMVKSLEKKAYEMGEKTKDMMECVENYTKDKLDTIEKQVRAYPFFSMSIAFVAGVLISKLTSSKK